MVEQNCPICNKNAIVGERDCYKINCSRCGEYLISRVAYSDLVDDPKTNFGIDSIEKRSVISHVLSKNNNRIKLTSDLIDEILKNNSLPNVVEQANNLILYLGEKLNSPSNKLIVEISTGIIELEKSINLYSNIGLNILTAIADFNYIRKYLIDNYIISREDTTLAPKVYGLQLTFLGWQKYEELRHSVENSKKAFLAMEFYSEEKEQKGIDYYFQKKIYPDFLKKSVEDTGYKLENPLLDPKSGNIHARLEVEIRNSRFVIAELSHHNNGAYWEAGFARGLGKPVIYMYNKEIGGTEKPHFDVGSDHIIFWEKDKPEEAAQKLKDCIRATLFGEAKMED